MLSVIFMLALLFTSLFLILLILVQRGKGGGLAGALGGAGGQSAFGSKAGDTFTRITIGLAFLWIVLCLGAVATLKAPESRFPGDEDPIASQEQSTDTTTGDAGKTVAPTGNNESNE
ncbi:MAG: preprotein translocase subunit SecG [Planctomycetia bacterium]|jgi:preprotein translocase subunit SecG